MRRYTEHRKGDDQPEKEVGLGTPVFEGKNVKGTEFNATIPR